MHLDGSPWNGKVEMYLFPAADSSVVYVGDPVISGGDAGAAGVTVYGIDCEGMPTADVAAAGSTLLGVVVGFLPKQSNLEVLHREASINRIGLVCTAPDVVYEVQEDSVGNNIAATQVGNNFDIVYAAGSSVTGRSAVEIDSSDVTGTATAQLRLLGLSKRVGNVIGTNAKWLVLINEHEFKTTTGV
jgi:hypothetical protein